MSVKYGGDTEGIGPSPEIWGRMNVEHARKDPSQGYEFFDDFLNFGTQTAADATAAYTSAVDAGGTIIQLASEVGGVIRVLTDAGADDGLVMTTGGNVAAFLKIVQNSRIKAAFEARIRLNEAVLGQSFFIGMMEEALATTDTILADAGTGPPDKDYVGFRILEADPNGLDAVHRTASGTAEVVVLEEAQVITAAAWYKVGWWFDGINTIHFVVDGVEVATCSADDTDFPDDNYLSPYIAYKEHSGSAESVDMDWWRAYCSRIEGA